MIAFEVKLNEELLTIAGANDLSVLTAIITAVGKLGIASAGAAQRESNYELELTVGGLTSRSGGAPNEHLDWSKRTLKRGDVVTVKLVEVDAADAQSTLGRNPRMAITNASTRNYRQRVPIQPTTDNKSLDASGGGVFRMIIGPAMVE
jgi:hypothetical protein